MHTPTKKTKIKNLKKNSPSARPDLAFFECRALAICLFLTALDEASDLCNPVHIRFRWQREFTQKVTDHLTEKAIEIKIDVGLSSHKFDRLRHHMYINSDRDPPTRQYMQHEALYACSLFVLFLSGDK